MSSQYQETDYVKSLQNLLPTGFFASYIAVAKLLVGDNHCQEGDNAWMLIAVIVGFVIAVAISHIVLRVGNTEGG